MPGHPRWFDYAALSRLKVTLLGLLDRLREFIYQEWSSVLIWSAIGISSAAIERYSGIPIWDQYLADSRQKMDVLMRHAGLTEGQVRDKKTFPDWPTLGKYIGDRSPNQYKSSWRRFRMVRGSGIPQSLTARPRDCTRLEAFSIMMGTPIMNGPISTRHNPA